MTNIIEYLEKILLLVAALFSVSLGVPSAELPLADAGTTTARVIAVIDGDTIEVVIGTSTKTTRVRYIGIDTPEPYRGTVPECGSAEASARNKELVDEQIVTLVPGAQAYDDYGRLLAYVYVGETFVNQALVSEGFATVMMIKPNVTFQSQFMTAYQSARHQKLGIWGYCP